MTAAGHTQVLATGTHMASVQVAGGPKSDPAGPYYWIAQRLIQ